jgi:cytochrome c oxidase cbb3-type subunit I/II
MPRYLWLHADRLDPDDVTASVRALRRAGVPYTEAEVAAVPDQMARQGATIVNNLATMGLQADADLEIIALIAYLQRLGVDGRAAIEARAQTEAMVTPAEGGI